MLCWSDPEGRPKPGFGRSCADRSSPWEVSMFAIKFEPQLNCIFCDSPIIVLHKQYTFGFPLQSKVNMTYTFTERLVKEQMRPWILV